MEDPFQDLSNIQMDDLELLPEVLFKRLGNTTSRKSLLNPKEWRNVLYDPATTSEENFRSSKGIDLKKKRTKNNHYCPVKILDLEINRVDHHPLGR